MCGLRLAPIGYQLQQEVQQQLPPPHVVLAPGATWTKAPPVAVLPTWPVNVSMNPHLPSEHVGSQGVCFADCDRKHVAG